MKDKPAFPKLFGPKDSDEFHPGMTLREYYAGCALQGLLANPTVINMAMYVTEHDTDLADDIKDYAKMIADAMIAAGSVDK